MISILHFGNNKLISTYKQVVRAARFWSRRWPGNKLFQTGNFVLWHSAEEYQKFDRIDASLPRHGGKSIASISTHQCENHISLGRQPGRKPLTKNRGINGVLMAKLEFPPVVLENSQIGRTETISSISQAAAFLLNGWPKKKSPAHLEARVACYEAQSGLVSVDAARVVFVEAAIEADIYVGQKPPATLYSLCQSRG
ncbi:DUF982 domain-containing protein [Phyllobacterium sp. K27]